MSETAVRSTYRHRLPVRVMHWINVVCLFVLLMSGLAIFNAHPMLYWGKYSTFDKPALALTGQKAADGSLKGYTVIGSHRFDTTGVFGASNNMLGTRVMRGFPTWATLPGGKSLSKGRQLHFFFAWLFVINGLSYLIWTFVSKHMSRDLWPTGADWRGMAHSIIEHLKFKHPTGDEAARYNILQKLAYLAVILVFIPGIILMGLGMSPHMDSVLGWLLDLVGGRQSARSLHFIFAMLLLAFICIHVFMVFVTGPINQIRAMITGRYEIHDDPAPDKPVQDTPAPARISAAEVPHVQ
jgi:thiosulfate reductase cytochrome b subunit